MDQVIYLRREDRKIMSSNEFLNLAMIHKAVDPGTHKLNVLDKLLNLCVLREEVKHYSFFRQTAKSLYIKGGDKAS